MAERFISEQGNAITINTLAAPALEAFGQRSYLGGRVTIEETALPDSKINHPLHATCKTVYRVEIKEGLKDTHGSREGFAMNLICQEDEFFYSIQEEYLHLLDDGEVDDAELWTLLSPRVELPVPETVGGTHVSKISAGNVRHLLNRTEAEREKLAKRFKAGSLEISADAPEGSIQNRFYLVLNKFQESEEVNSSKGTSFLEFDGAGFRELEDGEVPDIPGDGLKRIAIIVHGLASRIREAYHELAIHLEREGYHVFGFDYLTINQPIADSGKGLSENIKNLRTKYPESEVLIVAHSMGGLVARSAEVVHGAEIDQLIMAGTPNSGSLLVSNQNLVRNLFLLGSLMKLLPIKSEDLRQLIVSKKLRGLDDLANKSAFISELNANDRLHYSKKYFSLAGHFEGAPHDLIVHSGNMTKINETHMPSIPVEKDHFGYFKGTGWHEPLDKALLYLK